MQVHDCHHSIRTHTACVSLVPIFNHLEEEQMEEIMLTAHSVSYKRGEIIYHVGDQSDSLYIVNKGKIKIYRLSESGKEQLVRILNPGDFTGELAYLAKLFMSHMQRQCMNTQVCLIKRSDLQEFL